MVRQVRLGAPRAIRAGATFGVFASGFHACSPEGILSAELIAIIAAAVSLGGTVIVTTGSIRSEVRRQGEQIGALAERVARLEGVLSTLQDLLIRGRTDQQGAA